ncbi:MAG: hypothetical protein LBL65_04610 [Campylobacteraceae bacterium]|jgi:uncharacterized membrane protein|nr:hypothetical protein [Campylobacteraceae bacterium]
MKAKMQKQQIQQHASTKTGMITSPKEMTLTQTAYSGPIPPPEYLEKYKEIREDIPDRIMKMAEDDLKNTHHNKNMESYITILAVLMGGGLCFAIMFCGYKLIIQGHDIGGYIALMTGLSPIIIGTIEIFKIASKK